MPSKEFLVSREMSAINMELIDLYYRQEDLDSETAKALVKIRKHLNDTIELLIFGPGEGHRGSRA